MGSSTEELLATVVQAGAAGFSEKNYWNTFHDRDKGGEPFEWYASWQRIKDLVLSKKPPSSTVSVLVPYVLPCHPRSHPLLSFPLAISIESPGSNFSLAPHFHAHGNEKHIERVLPKIPQKIPQNSTLKHSNRHSSPSGCGDSSLCKDMAGDGYGKITGIDFSPAAIERCHALFPAAKYPLLDFKLEDVTECASLQACSYDLILDKATLDALTGEGTPNIAPVSVSARREAA